MVTINARVLQLSLSLDKKQRSLAGELIAASFKKQNALLRCLTPEIHEDREVLVWSYPEDFLPDIDRVLFGISRPRRQRINAIKINP